MTQVNSRGSVDGERIALAIQRLQLLLEDVLANGIAVGEYSSSDSAKRRCLVGYVKQHMGLDPEKVESAEEIRSMMEVFRPMGFKTIHEVASWNDETSVMHAVAKLRVTINNLRAKLS